jgi:hypothetical protein
VGHVLLRDDALEAVRLELVLAERAGEEPARVLAPLEIDDERAFQLGLGEDHDVPPRLRTFSTIGLPFHLSDE